MGHSYDVETDGLWSTDAYDGDDAYATEDLAEVFRDVLDDDYQDATPEELDDALCGVLESMSPAEGFSFAKALKQIERGAGQVVSDPVFGQVARTALPIAGGALGTVIGGPVGTAVGSNLGTAVAKAIPAKPTTAPVPPGRAPAAAARPASGAIPAVAGGSAAAARGLVLTQQPDVLKGLLSLALGRQGQQSVNGVPVASIMSMLSSVFGQAAADADELMFLEVGDGLADGAFDAEAAGPDRSIYTTLMDADNAELAEALGLS